MNQTDCTLSRSRWDRLLLQDESGTEVKRIAKERGIGLIMESADIAKQRLQRRRSGSYLLRDFLRIGHNIE